MITASYSSRLDERREGAIEVQGEGEPLLLIPYTSADHARATPDFLLRQTASSPT
jgi:hypothetical protein